MKANQILRRSTKKFKNFNYEILGDKFITYENVQYFSSLFLSNFYSEKNSEIKVSSFFIKDSS